MTVNTNTSPWFTTGTPDAERATASSTDAANAATGHGVRQSQATGPDVHAWVRRDAVQAFRDFADFLEANPWFPVPYPITVQADIPRNVPAAQHHAKLRTLADLLGAEVTELPGGSRDTGRAFGTQLTYIIHAPAPEPGAPAAGHHAVARRGSRYARTVPAREDAARSGADVPL